MYYVKIFFIISIIFLVMFISIINSEKRIRMLSEQNEDILNSLVDREEDKKLSLVKINFEERKRTAEDLLERSNYSVSVIERFQNIILVVDGITRMPGIPIYTVHKLNSIIDDINDFLENNLLTHECSDGQIENILLDAENIAEKEIEFLSRFTELQKNYIKDYSRNLAENQVAKEKKERAEKINETSSKFLEEFEKYLEDRERKRREKLREEHTYIIDHHITIK